MKKMNRSQSSYRNCKTLITEEDQQNHLPKYAGKNYASRYPNNITNSFIEMNKENNSLFQSVSQRNFVSKSRDQISEFQVGKDQSRIWQDRCKKLEDEIKKLHKDRDSQYQSLSTLKNSKNYNYTEQMLTREVEQLKNEIMKKDRQLQYYRQQYSSKNDEVSCISSQLTSKIQKDQKDKNLFVKQINSKQIQINNLQQKVKYHKSQIQTQKIYLAQKDSIINELEQKLNQVDMKKKKVESYEFQLKNNEQIVKQLEIMAQRLKEKTEEKDKTISQKVQAIHQLQQTLQSYEDKLRSMEQSLLNFNQQRKAYKEKIQGFQRQISDWKQSYDQLLKKSSSVQQYELKLKAYTSMIDELNKTKTQLVSSNEKYKIAYTTLQKSLIKYQDMEKQMLENKKDLKDKNDRIAELLDLDRNRKHIEEYNTKLRKEKDQMFTKIQEKNREVKAVQSMNDDLKLKMKMVEEELRQIQGNNLRFKDRSEKLDAVMKQNGQLNETIIKKVDQIERLQYKINNLQNKLSNLQNQLTKQKLQMQERENEIRQLAIQNDDIRARYETQINSRVMTQDKLVRSNQQNMTLKFQITKNEEEILLMKQQMSNQTVKHEGQLQQVKSLVSAMEKERLESDRLLEDSNTRINQLKNEIEQFKKVLDDSSRKQRQHKQSISNLEKQLMKLRNRNEQLANTNLNMVENASKINQLSQLIMKLKVQCQ